MIICKKCNIPRKRQENFLDLSLTVKDNKGVDEALKALFSFEQFTEDNKLECEYCQEKTDSEMG